MKNNNNPDIKTSLREDALEWFFTKTDNDKINLKDKHFKNEYISYDNQWGFHFTFGQIEEMYIKEVNK